MILSLGAEEQVTIVHEVLECLSFEQTATPCLFEVGWLLECCQVPGNGTRVIGVAGLEVGRFEGWCLSCWGNRVDKDLSIYLVVDVLLLVFLLLVRWP